MKVIFVLPTYNSSHTNKRMKDFIDNGYEVEAYGFDRPGNVCNATMPCKVTILGEIKAERYFSRIPIYIKTFIELGKKYKNQKVIFYFRGLDLAMFHFLINPCIPYILEECDLVHTSSKFEKILEWIDKRVIRKSIATVFTSEGFIKYHFGNRVPKNALMLENKLNPSIKDIALSEKKQYDIEHLSIGFVGAPRFKSIYNFIDMFCKNFPQHTFHVYGAPIPEGFIQLQKYSNCLFHGVFSNPKDLPEIYSSIDYVLATYDSSITNVRYAEPNKLYESIYFETPIIVSKGTYLAEKVSRLNVGYEVNAMDESAITELVKSFNRSDYKESVKHIGSLNKEDTISKTDDFFVKLRHLIDNAITEGKL